MSSAREDERLVESHAEDRDRQKEPKSSAHDAAVELSQLIDTIGCLRIIVAKRVELRTSASDFSLSTLSSFSEIDMVEIPSVLPNINVWYDEGAQLRYAIYQERNAFKFNDLDSFLSSLLKDFDEECKLSATYVKEPSRIVIANDIRCYDPEVLGLPLSSLVRYGVIDDAARMAIGALCLPGAERPYAPRFVSTNSFEYAPRAATREMLINYSERRMRAIQNSVYDMIATYNLVRRASIQLPRPLDAITSLKPVHYPGELSGLYDQFNLSGVYLRFEALTELCGVNFSLSPLESSLLLKTTSQAITRMGFVTDLASTSYSANMADEIAALIQSYFMPGEILMELCLDDLPSGVTELRALAALFSLMFLMYDEQSTWSNMTRGSLTTIQLAIIQMGVSKHSLIRNDNPMDVDFPLSGYSARGFPDINLLYLRNQDGVAGMNCGRRNAAADAMAEFYPGCGVRMNVGPDFQDWEIYRNEVLDTNNWGIVGSITALLSGSMGMNVFSAFTQAIAYRIQSFFVRLNEHSSCYWYNSVRASEANQALRTYAYSEANAIKVRISGKTILHLARSLCGDADVIPINDFMTRLKFEYSLIGAHTHLAMKYNLIVRFINDLGVTREYSPSRIMRIISAGSPFCEHFCEMVRHANETRNLNEEYFRRFHEVETYDCYHSLMNVSWDDLREKGVVRGYVAHVLANSITSVRLNQIMLNEGFYDSSIPNNNFEEVTSDVLRRYLGSNSFDYRLFRSNIHPIIPRLPFCFAISHSMPSGFSDHIIKVNDDKSQLDIRTRVSMGELVIHMAPVNPREYIYDDDFAPSSLQVFSSRMLQEDFRGIHCSFDDLIAGLGARAHRIDVFCESMYTWSSLFCVLP